jgi:hypothetical protein
VLPAGGQLIFDVIETGSPPLTSRGWQAGADWAVLVANTEHEAERRLTRAIEIFRGVDAMYRRSREIREVALFDAASVVAALEAAGFETESAASYGAQPLPPRRRAFFATRR